MIVPMYKTNTKQCGCRRSYQKGSTSSAWNIRMCVGSVLFAFYCALSYVDRSVVSKPASSFTIPYISSHRGNFQNICIFFFQELLFQDFSEALYIRRTDSNAKLCLFVEHNKNKFSMIFWDLMNLYPPV